jgi:acetylornithine/succinyldiaminopimelate/putrescine aminotransferase
MGRTGTWFGYQAYGVDVDGFTLAKALGGGFPVGACVAGSKLKDLFKPGHHASTFGGNPLACAAGSAVIDIIQSEGLVDRAAEKGAWLLDQLRSSLQSVSIVDQVRGRGLMIGIVLVGPAAEAASRMQSAGLIVIPTAGNVLRLVPPLNTTDEDFEKALGIITGVLTELDSQAK